MKKIITLIVVALTALTVTACNSKRTDNSVVGQTERYQQQDQKRLLSIVGYPQIRNSLELRNIKRRYELLENDPHRIGYVVELLQNSVYAVYRVEGKVSSLNSEFTNLQQFDCTRIRKHQDGRNLANSQDVCGVIDQAEPDGSYGSNPQGIFFWDTNGVYHEWSGEYEYTTSPPEIHNPVVNVQSYDVGAAATNKRGG